MSNQWTVSNNCMNQYYVVYRVLSSGRKIGEGVFGEVFMLERPGEGRSVIKIIPIEGSQMVNGSVQKRYDEVLSELIITE